MILLIVVGIGNVMTVVSKERGRLDLVTRSADSTLTCVALRDRVGQTIYIELWSACTGPGVVSPRADTPMMDATATAVMDVVTSLGNGYANFSFISYLLVTFDPRD